MEALLVAGTSSLERLGHRRVQSVNPEHVVHGEAAVPNFTEAPRAKHPLLSTHRPATANQSSLRRCHCLVRIN